MKLLDLLGLGAGAVVGARTAKDEGMRQQAELERQTLLDRLKQEQDAEDREMRRRLTEAQIGNFESLAKERQMPSSSPGARAQYDPARGGWVLPPDEQNPQGRFVQPEGIVPRPEAPRAPQRGTPEYEEAIRREAQIRAEVQASTPLRSATPTEAQEKSYLYAQMMAQASPVIDELAGKVNANQVSLALSPMTQAAEQVFGPGSISGRVTGADEQRLLNAARTFAAGVLRKESGAAITESELRDTFARFIPLAGDSPEVVAQKQANRKAVEALLNDLSLPASAYYERMRALPKADGSPSAAPLTAPVTPNAPPPQTPPDFEAWRRSRRPE